MPTPRTDANGGAESVGVGAAVKQVTDHAKTLIGLEVELAKLELKRKVAAFGLGIGLLVGAALFGVFALGFLFATAAAGLATFLSTWLALLIVAAFLLVLAAVLGLVGVKKLQPPVPQEAIREAKLTTAALKGDGGY